MNNETMPNAAPSYNLSLPDPAPSSSSGPIQKTFEYVSKTDETVNRNKASRMDDLEAKRKAKKEQKLADRRAKSQARMNAQRILDLAKQFEQNKKNKPDDDEESLDSNLSVAFSSASNKEKDMDVEEQAFQFPPEAWKKKDGSVDPKAWEKSV